MLVERAKVLSVLPDRVVLETQTASACGACAQGKGCGTAKIAKAFTREHAHLEVFWQGNVEPGEEVELLLPENTLFSSSFLLYLLPLFMLLGGAIFFDYLLHQLFLYSEPLLIVLAAMTAGLGWWVARLLIRRREYSGDDYIRLRKLGGELSPRIPIRMING